MEDHLSTSINIITGNLIDKSDKVKDKIQKYMSRGFSKSDSLKISFKNPHDKRNSHMSSPDKSAVVKNPNNGTIQRLKM